MSLHYSLANVNQTRKKESSRDREKGDKWPEFARWFSDKLGTIISAIEEVPFAEAEEIRVRTGQPLLIQCARREVFLGVHGEVTNREKAYKAEREDLIQTLERITHSSFYAAEEELKQGFITLPGGHRVGVTGQAILQHGSLQTIKHISGLNFRIAREVSGQGMGIMPFLFTPQGEFEHTLLISPPRAGKTTLLREMIRLLSNGIPKLGVQGQTVGVIDERGEIAGMWQGVPTYDLGYRTDVLDNCPKATGMGMLVRAMAPNIVAMDELGHLADVAAVTDALRTGVSILATAHAGTFAEAKERPSLRALFDEGVFKRLIVLSRRQGPGTVEGIYDMKTGEELRKFGKPT